MKKKYITIPLIAMGVTLAGLSIILATASTANTNIIGGADFPTFLYIFFHRNGGLYSTLAFYGITVIIAAVIAGCKRNFIKNIAVLIAPLWTFPILRGPYRWINQQYIVKWFGCGCPVVDELGHEVHFNANQFTGLFWLVVCFGVAGVSIFISKRIPKDKMWLRVLYVIGIVVLSAFIGYNYYRSMRWG